MTSASKRFEQSNSYAELFTGQNWNTDETKPNANKKKKKRKKDHILVPAQRAKIYVHQSAIRAALGHWTRNGIIEEW